MSGGEQIDLDQLIEERKKKKRKALKKRLRLELKTIRERRVPGVNHEPFPHGVFERLTSNDIWENVLGYVTEPCDVTSAFFACGTFAEILEQRRKVLNIFRTNVDKAYEFTNRAGLQQSRIWKTTCLNARTVSKAWKEIADFQLFDSDFDLTKSGWFLKTDYWIDHSDPRSNACVLPDEEYVDEVLSLLSDATNPSCLIRNVIVEVADHAQDPEPFYTSIVEFLEMHGQSVWFFYFNCDIPLNFGRTNERLCEMLESMPNLKGLVLECRSTYREEEEFLQILDRPFPVLASLEHLACHREIDETLVFEILWNCVNLRSVDYSQYQTITEEVTEALMELSLEHYDGLNLDPIINRAWWPLKHLGIYEEYTDSFTASVLFPAINHFRETLEYLQFWETIKMDADAMRFPLDLPHLKTLFLNEIGCGTIGFDDLLLLKSLERISVYTFGDEDDPAKVKIKRYFDSGDGDMDKSNVWECFPNLIRIGINFNGFYRPSPP